MANGQTPAVLAGIGAGITIIALFSIYYSQSSQSSTITSILDGDYHPRPGRIAEQAVRIALENSTIQQLFEGREMVVTSVRDWGVAAGLECPIGWCAIILFDDKSDDITTGFAAATVSVKAAKVIDFSLHHDILIERANDTKEARHFLSKYPDAQVDVKRDGTNADVAYTIARQLGAPPDSVERKRVLAIGFDKTNLMKEPSEFRLYCINVSSDNLSTPAIGGDIIGRIDNEGCFGK